MKEGLVLVLVNSGGFFMFEGVKIHAQLLRTGDLAKVIPVMPRLLGNSVIEVHAKT